MAILNWEPNDIFTELANACPIVAQLPDAVQYQGVVETRTDYACLATNNNPVVDSSPDAIISSAQNRQWRSFLLQVGRWGRMIPGPLGAPFKNIYGASNPDEVTEDRLVEIETALDKAYDMLRKEEEFEKIWNRLRELGWSKVIISKCLHFMARAAGVKGVIPVPIDGKMSVDWLWKGFKTAVENNPNLEWPSPGSINDHSYISYNRYMSAMVAWADKLEIEVGVLEVRLFAQRNEIHRDNLFNRKIDSSDQDNTPPNTINGEGLELPSSNPKKPILWVVQNHENDTAITLKEDCPSRWNLGWICQRHGFLNFKSLVARDLNRYIIGEIIAQGENPRHDNRWVPSDDGATDCSGGTAYEGWLEIGSLEGSLCTLKQFFILRACPENTLFPNRHLYITQEWIDALECGE